MSTHRHITAHSSNLHTHWSWSTPHAKDSSARRRQQQLRCSAVELELSKLELLRLDSTKKRREGGEGDWKRGPSVSSNCWLWLLHTVCHTLLHTLQTSPSPSSAPPTYFKALRPQHFWQLRRALLGSNYMLAFSRVGKRGQSRGWGGASGNSAENSRRRACVAVFHLHFARSTGRT